MLPITGYADRWSVKPGEVIRFMVSVQGGAPYSARVARVHCGDPNPAGPGYREVPMECAIQGQHQGLEQPIRLGSHVAIPALDLGPADGLIGLVATVWPTLPERPGVVFAWRGGGVSLVLGVGPEGAFCEVDGQRVATGVPLTPRAWHDIAVALDSASGTLTLRQQPRKPRIDRAEAAEATAPFPARPAGMGSATIACDPAMERHFNGKIERPRLAAGLDATTLLATQEAGASLPAGTLRAEWDFSIGMTGDRVADIGPGHWHGRCVNLPTRAVTGSRWTATHQRWTEAPEQWAAIHFHDDDIGDAGWQPSLSLTIPEGWPSGVYALHLEGAGWRDNIAFYVRAVRPGQRAKVAFLAPTFTYTIYGNFARPGRQAQLHDRAVAWGALQQSPDGHPEYGFSTYNWHTDGSGIAYASMRRPMIDKRVNHIQMIDPSPEGSGTYWITADSYVTDMLDRHGIDYEVVTDHDLHAEGAAALAPYSVVLTGQHPEYHSDRTLHGIADYIGGGGRFVYLGGNGFYWKVVPHGEGPWALEVRRAEGGIRLWAAEPGESYHAFDGSYGGLWRRLGRPPQSVVGIGFSTQGDYNGHPYRFAPGILDPRVAFLREGMEAAPGQEFGERGFMGGGAAGHELDRADTRLGTPHHALIVATAIVTEPSYAPVNEERYDHTLWPRQHDEVMRSDITFFEASKGGAVLSFGSMNYIGALPVDGYTAPAARLVLNAIRRFMDPAPFPGFE
ncbi:N,N-dimethylformamidase beta subunit family domain-containing protein [Belnapia moabensis]|uniref:N,N-dimethylformamidase beta subunit family domain-containing protein n=1 Tax=Belnapia moabensis TaxID=365533 RepID=UPI0005BA43FC|nr:N,N-dimethylformamidase beta subunit family domain-containing protein [Belnapia moabensis]